MSKTSQLETPNGVVTLQTKYLRHFEVFGKGEGGVDVKIGRIMRDRTNWVAGYADEKRSYFHEGFEKRRDAAGWLVEKARAAKVIGKQPDKIEKPAKVKKAKAESATSAEGEVLKLEKKAKAPAKPKAAAKAKPKAAPAKLATAEVEAELAALLAMPGKQQTLETPPHLA